MQLPTAQRKRTSLLELTSEARTMLLVALDCYIKQIGEENEFLIDAFVELESSIGHYDPVVDWQRLCDAKINAEIVENIDASERAHFDHAMRSMPEDQLDLEDFLAEDFLAGYPCDTEPRYDGAQAIRDAIDNAVEVVNTDVNPNGEPLYPRPVTPQHEPEQQKKVTK